MNKEYTYIDGKVIVRDNWNSQKLVEYCDNLEEVLIQENLIELMENEEERLNEKYIETTKKIKGNKKINILKKIILPYGIMGVLVLLLTILSNLLFPSFLTLIPSFKIFINIVSFVIGSLIFTPLVINDYSDYIKLIKEKKGIENQLDYLNKQIVKEKEKLKTLQKNKTKNNEINEFKTVQISSLDDLRKLRDHIGLLFDLGYNEKKYYKYFEEGKLDKKLSKCYNEKGIEVAKEYFEEKGPTLVKIKNKKHN